MNRAGTPRDRDWPLCPHICLVFNKDTPQSPSGPFRAACLSFQVQPTAAVSKGEGLAHVCSCTGTFVHVLS